MPAEKLRRLDSGLLLFQILTHHHMKTIHYTSDAPAPIGPYSQAVWAGHTLYISGQVAINPSTGKVLDGDTRDQLTLLMDNLQAIITSAGLTMEHIVKVSAFLIDMGEYAIFNEVYGRYFDHDTAPAREAVQVSALPAGVRVEVSAIAYDPSK